MTLKEFLDSSTIHGLSYISSSKRIWRVFWTLVVATGFSTAGIMIYQAFQGWEENPITTTIETLPIDKLDFPKVTVCPPENTFTDLNYDLVLLENMTLNTETRNELKAFAFDLVHDDEFEKFMSLYDLMEYEDMYYWMYEGSLALPIPYIDQYGVKTIVATTFAPKGVVSTQNYGKDFSLDLDRKVKIELKLRMPCKKCELNIFMEKITTEDSQFTLKGYFQKADVVSKNFTEKTSVPVIYKRELSESDVDKLDTHKMLGCRFAWSYDPEVNTQSSRSYVVLLRK